MIKIALDASGGDNHPDTPVEGAILAHQEDQNITITLYGNNDEIYRCLKKHKYETNRITIVPTYNNITMDDSPTKAIYLKQESSIIKGLKALADGMVDGFVSAGNTGALLTASTLILGKLEGISRPTIAAVIPTLKGKKILVDVGANLEFKEKNFHESAVIGRILAQEILNIKEPSVGLINVGSESGKGIKVYKKAYKSLQEHTFFQGNVEGHGIFKGQTDVMLCDGFVGNIILKLSESIVRVFGHLIQTNANSIEEKNAMKSIMHKISHIFDYEAIGGLPFLGVKGVSLVGHGGSSAQAIKNMICSAVQCIRLQLIDKLQESLLRYKAIYE